MGAKAFKEYVKRTTLLTICMIALQILPVDLQGQEPPHPPSVGHGVQGNQTAGNARLTDGISILIAFGLAYGYRRYSMSRKSEVIAESSPEEE